MLFLCRSGRSVHFLYTYHKIAKGFMVLSENSGLPVYFVRQKLYNKMYPNRMDRAGLLCGRYLFGGCLTMFMYTDYNQHLLDNVKKIHFIGCGGSGMYPLLWLLMSSFKSNDTMFHNAWSLIPEKWDILTNYLSGWKRRSAAGRSPARSSRRRRWLRSRWRA